MSPHAHWRTAKDWSKVDRAFDLPSDEDLITLATTLSPAVGRIRPQDPVLSALVGERHFCRWARAPMRWRDRTLIREPVVMNDGSKVGVACRWVPFSGEIPPLFIIPYSGMPGYDIVVAAVYHDLEFEPELVGWQTIPYWKEHGTRAKLNSGLAGRSLPRTFLIPMKGIKEHQTGKQVSLPI